MLSWGGMWISGSRGAFGGAVLGLIVVVMAEMASVDARRRWQTLAALFGAVATVAAVLYLVPTKTSPIERFEPWFAGITTTEPLTFIAIRWDPYYYGQTAWRALQDSPVFGIGLGMFHRLVGSYSIALDLGPLPPDNAQNWFRHQLTELGVLGSIPWSFWVLCAALLLVFPVREPRTGWIAKGVLFICGANSLIGMPGQNIPIVVLFWTVAFVVTQYATPRWPRILMACNRPVPWIALAVACAIGTAVVGASTMMPPDRAARFHERYAVGVTGLTEADGRGEFVMLGRRSFVVVPPASPFLRVSAALMSNGAPVDVRVSVNHRTVIDGPVSDVERVELTTLRDVSDFAVLDVSSTTDVPAPDGIRIRWEFLPASR
jgi:hypothetical protein